LGKTWFLIYSGRGICVSIILIGGCYELKTEIARADTRLRDLFNIWLSVMSAGSRTDADASSIQVLSKIWIPLKIVKQIAKGYLFPNFFRIHTWRDSQMQRILTFLMTMSCRGTAAAQAMRKIKQGLLGLIIYMMTLWAPSACKFFCRRACFQCWELC